MDSLSKKLQNLGIHDIRNAARFAQNVIVQYEPYQIDIRRATNTDAWGPTPKHLSKVLRNRYQVPMYLMTEYILKRLIDHIAKRPKNLYEKARKDYVNYGAEWRVVLKCLVVIEFLMLNVDDGDELNQIKSCLMAHKHILTREVANFKVSFSNDGKMEVHERGIKKKNELILQYLDDAQFLKKERLKNKKNAQKIRNNVMAGGVGNDLSTVGSGASASYNANHPSYSGDHVMNSDGFDYDFDDESPTRQGDDDDEFNDFTTNASSNQPKRTPTNLERQRKQRREILRERIKNTEQQRKNREQIKKQQEEQANVPDLLDLDFDSPAPSSPSNTNTNINISNSIPTSGTTNLNVSGNNNDDDDDDDDGFGDFQSEPTATSAPTPATTTIVNKNATLDELLGKTTTSTNNNNNNTSLNDKDLFSDLFNNSKSLI
ncbi:epsin-5 [Monosporozyma unispora]|nr:hypothetical protein C6P44_004869 [Kazachstania unispora]